jgi:hypothetical protein
MNPRKFIVVAAMLLAPGAAWADVVLDWNEIAAARSIAAKQPPPTSARSMALVHVAMFDAINAIQRRYTPYAFRQSAAPGASPEAAASAAAHAVLIKLFPDQAQPIDAAYNASLAKIPDGEAKSAGIALGMKSAEACLAQRAGDGAGQPSAYRAKITPGVYTMTVDPVSREWAQVKPWFLSNAAQFRPGRPPALTSAQWARDYNEIKSVGAKNSTVRTPEQTDTARFFQAVGVVSWNPVVRSAAQSKSLDLLDNARLFALANMAAMDAFIAVFDAKYAHNFWRPITAIRNGDIDGNNGTEREAQWQPLIDTPLHPEYPCAHCITAAAVGEVLELLVGKGEIGLTSTSPTAPGVTKRWARAADYVEDVKNARIWAGVHYRNSTDVGAAMGRQIGALAVQNGMKSGLATR